jgi:hypothetical protein
MKNKKEDSGSSFFLNAGGNQSLQKPIDRGFSTTPTGAN